MNPVGTAAEDPAIATALKAHGYATGQSGKNHLGDRDEFLPTMHGFDEFFGNLYVRAGCLLESARRDRAATPRDAASELTHGG